MSILYLVATPIGNLGDFSERARETLMGVDFIAAEDTRVSVKLLNKFGIKKPLVSYFEHNARFRGEQIMSRILGGESCAVVTDAGTPCVSDPGEELVRMAAESGIPVVVIPGACAAIAALAASGLKTGRFSFEGFLSVKKSSRVSHLNEIKNDTRTLIFYEAPHKLLATLCDMHEVLGDRRVCLAREMTKLHEEICRTTLLKAAEHFAENKPRGEFVIVVEGTRPVKEIQATLDDAVRLMGEYIEGGEKPAFAARKAAGITGLKKSDIYFDWNRRKKNI